MIIFRYTSQTPAGKTVGVITAQDRHDAERQLRQRGEAILRLETVSSGPEESPYFTLRERSAMEKFYAGHKIGSGSCELFLRQLSVLLAGGVPILAALQSLAMQENYHFKRAIFCTANKIREGHPLSATLQSELPFLGEITIGLIAAGEANGEIDKMCDYAANLIQRRRALKMRILQALFYPALVMVILVAVLAFLFVYVIPKIMEFLTQRSGSLPGITQALVDVVNFINAYWPYLLGAPVVIFIALYLLHRFPPTGYILDFIVLHIPLFGKVFRSSSNALFCRILGTLLKSGISIINAMKFTEQSMQNRFYRFEIAGIAKLIALGHPLSTGLRVSRIHRYIPLAESMISVGENTGHVDEGLIRISEFAEESLDRRIGFLSKLIEPALFLIVGGIVGFVYIAFFVALMSLSRPAA